MSDTEPRPFSAKEVAEVLDSGRAVKLGNVFMKREGEAIASCCASCGATMNLPLTAGAAGYADDAIAFILKHQHKDTAPS